MLGRRDGRGNKALLALGVVIAGVEHRRNIIGAFKAQQVAAARLRGILKAGHAAKREIVALKIEVAYVRAGFLCPALADSPVVMRDSGVSGGFPQLRREHGFQVVHQPEEFRKGIGNGQHRHFHRHFAAFIQRFDMQRQITELMQRTNVVRADSALADIAVHHRLILIYHFRLRAREELLVKQIDQEPLQESLQAEEHQLAVRDRRVEMTVAARRKVGIDFSGACRVLLAVRHFVAINSQNRIHVHRPSPYAL
ncbi:hypothetical protein BN129_2907 [Cronobacter sakazakii 701]|nr:hypothetical protein BN129_2907 [Cronobacter sakazakii 701]